MRSDSDRNMSAALTRITRQVSRTFDLKMQGSKKEEYNVRRMFKKRQKTGAAGA